MRVSVRTENAAGCRIVVKLSIDDVSCAEATADTCSGAEQEISIPADKVPMYGGRVGWGVRHSTIWGFN